MVCLNINILMKLLNKPSVGEYNFPTVTSLKSFPFS